MTVLQIFETQKIDNLETSHFASESSTYINKATSLASDLERLRLLRKNLRKSMEDSVLMCGKKYASHFEFVIEQMLAEKMNVQFYAASSHFNSGEE